MKLSMRSAARRVSIATVICAGIGACTDQDIDIPLTDAGLFEPRAITTLRTQGVGSVALRLTVNDELVIDNQTVGENESRLSLDPALFTAATNVVTVSFWLTPNDPLFRDTPRLLADASVNVAKPLPGATVQIPPVAYRYPDSDGDSIADIHEWQITPADIDADQEANSEDDDADDDNVRDGIDVTPYGANLPFLSTDALTTLDLALTDSSARRLPISPGAAAVWSREVSSSRDAPVPLRRPGGWPFALESVPSAVIAERYNWRIVDVEDHVRQQCPDWRIALDASSLQATVNGAAMLYFRRSDAAAVAAPLQTGSIDNLADITASVPAAIESNTETARFDDALRLIIVAPLTTGWLTLWSDAGLTGATCSVNLTELTPVFASSGDTSTDTPSVDPENPEIVAPDSPDPDSSTPDSSTPDSQTQVPPVLTSFSVTPSPLTIDDTATFNWQVTTNGTEPVSCELDADGDADIDYRIDNCAVNTSVTHRYLNPGGYNARLTVRGTADETANATRQVTVLPLTLQITTTEPVNIGGRVRFDLVVENISPGQINDVRVLYRVPAGLSHSYTLDADPDGSGCGNCTEGDESFWSFDALRAGESRLITINPRVDTGLLPSSEIQARFTASAPTMAGVINRVHRIVATR